MADALQAQREFEVTFDRYDLHAGKDLTHFMDQVATCDRIVAIITPEYVRKARHRLGGVGYESSVLSAAVLADQLSARVVPVLREGNAMPDFLASKLYIDFRKERSFNEGMAELYAALRGTTAQRPLKLSDGSVQPAYVRILDHLDEFRMQMRGPTRALEDFAEVADVLREQRRIGQGIGIPPELVDAETRARSVLDRQRRGAADLVTKIYTVKRGGAVPDDASKKLNIIAELFVELPYVLAAAEPLFTSIAGGLTVHGLAQDPRFNDLAAWQQRYRVAVRQYIELVGHVRWPLHLPVDL